MSLVQMSRKEQAIKLRLEGKSYTEIMKALDVSSKGTISYWLQDIKLTPEAQERLKQNTELASKRGLLASNKKRSQRIKKENESLRKRAFKEVKALSKKDIRLIGAALYWAEGAKRFSAHAYPYISFSNSDPQMVQIFLRYVHEILQVSIDRIRPGVTLHPGIDIAAAKMFWSEITGIPEGAFWVSVNISRASQMKRPAHRLPHGTLSLRVYNRQNYFTMLGHIQGIAEQTKGSE